MAPRVKKIDASVNLTQNNSGYSSRSQAENIYSQNYIFYAHTENEAYIFKNLIEVLQNNLTDVCFNFDLNGIKLVTVDDVKNSKILIDLTLEDRRFNHWYCDASINVGINLQQLYKMIKSIKKKDSLTLYIARDKPNQLSIKRTLSTDAERKPDISHLAIQKLQTLEVLYPTDYKKFHLVSTSDFQKAVKEMAAMSRTIDIQSNDTQLTMRFSIDNLCGKVVELDQDPAKYSKDGYYHELEQNQYEFEQTYKSKMLSQFIKIPGLCPEMKVYAERDKLLKIEVAVGKLGILNICIRSE